MRVVRNTIFRKAPPSVVSGYGKRSINLNKVVATFEKHTFLSQTDLTRTGIISNSYNEMFEAYIVSYYVSTAIYVLLHCDEWDRFVAPPRHMFVTGATLLQLGTSVLSWDKHKHVAGLNLLIGSKSSLDNRSYRSCFLLNRMLKCYA